MNRVKCLIISLGLVLVAHIALAGDIERFSDSRGTIHITNVRPKPQGSPVLSAGAEACLPPGSSPEQAPVIPPALNPVFEAQALAPKPVAASIGPAPVDSLPALRPSQAKVSEGLMHLTYRTGEKVEPRPGAGAHLACIEPVSWAPPQRERPAPNDKTVMHRDRHGVIHITNVSSAAELPARTMAPAPAVQREERPPPAALPAVQEVSCPIPTPALPAGLEAKARAPSQAWTSGAIHRYRDNWGVWRLINELSPNLPLSQGLVAAVAGSLTVPVGAHAPPIAPVTQALAVEGQGLSIAMAPPALQAGFGPMLVPEVAAYIEGKLREHAAAWTNGAIDCYRDGRGVWNIVNHPAPDLPLPQAQLAAAAGGLTVPAVAYPPPVTQASAALARETGLVRPPPGSPDQRVVARRDHRGVLHIFNLTSAGFVGGSDSPASFSGKISPVLQACIVEAAQLYRLPVSLILAVIQNESNFAHQALSPKGAMGLMQLMPGTAASLGVRDPFDPRENVLAGCRYFRFLLDYFQGSVPLALAGYNAGYRRVISAGYQVPTIRETQEFVTRVMALYYLLEKQASSL